MSKQTAPIVKTCQSRAQCLADAIWGLYAWIEGSTDVNLDRPRRVFCGRHKPRLGPGVLLRNVRVRRR